MENEGNENNLNTDNQGEANVQATEETQQEVQESNPVKTTLGIDKAEESVEKETSEPIADFDYSEYEQEFIDTGDISSASRENLYKVFPKNLVDNYIENLKGAVTYNINQTEAKAFSVVGGKEEYQGMLEWASKNLSDDEIDTFNQMVGGKDEKLAIQAIKGLYARKSLGDTKKPSIIMGGASNKASGQDVFFSRKDYANAISDARYENSPEYRNEMANKLARTLKNGGFKA